MSSRLSTILSFFGTIVIVVAFFFATSLDIRLPGDPRQFQLAYVGA